MESFIYSLTQLTMSGRLQPAEQIICSHLLSFEDIVLVSKRGNNNDNNDNKDLDVLESLLIKILLINNGQLSMQCSIRIASCFLLLYEGSKINQTWNLFTEVQKRPYISTIYCIGYIIGKIGKNFTSLIPGFMKNILSPSSFKKINNSPPYSCCYIQSVLFALINCFKICRKGELSIYLDKVLLISKKGLTIRNDSVQLLSLKLMRTLLLLFKNDKSSKNSDISKSNISKTALTEIKNMFESHQNNNNKISQFVIEEMSGLIAKILTLDLNLEKEKNKAKNIIKIESSLNSTEKDGNIGNNENNGKVDDWKICGKETKNDEKNLRNAFMIIMRDFSFQMSLILRNLLFLLSPIYIHTNLLSIFNCIYKNMPDEITTLVNLISNDDRKILFEKVKSDTVTIDHFYILNILAVDDPTTPFSFRRTKENNGNDEPIFSSSSIVDTAAIAFQMITRSNDKKVLDQGISFFTRISKKNPEIAPSFVQAITVFLANPPENLPKINREIRGRSLIAATIIENIPSLAFSYKENLKNAIKNGLDPIKTKDVYSGKFFASFSLMTVVPSSFSSSPSPTSSLLSVSNDSNASNSFFEIDEAEKSIERFCIFFDNYSSNQTNENSKNDSYIKSRSELAASQISMFISQYSDMLSINITLRFFNLVINNRYLHSHASYICMMKSFIEICHSRRENCRNFHTEEIFTEETKEKIKIIAHEIHTFSFSISPPVDFISSSIQEAITSPYLILHNTSEIKRNMKKVFINIHPNVFSQNYILLYPEFIYSMFSMAGIKSENESTPQNYSAFFYELAYSFVQQLFNCLKNYDFNNSFTTSVSGGVSSFYNNIKYHLKNYISPSSSPSTSIAGNNFKINDISSVLLIFIYLLKNKTTVNYIPSNFLEILFQKISTIESSSSSSDYSIIEDLKIQLLSECIAIFASKHSEIVPQLFDLISSSMKSYSKQKCFLLSSLFCHVSLSDTSLASLLLNINNTAMLINMIKNENNNANNNDFNANNNSLIIYSLFSLNTLYQKYLSQLSMLKCIGDQSIFFLNLFHNCEISLDPFVLYMIGLCFGSLLSIISPELNSFQTSVKDSVQQVISCFEHSEVPFARRIYYQVLRSVYNFASNELKNIYSIDNKIKVFPSSKGTPLIEKISACGAFSDYSRIINRRANFMYLIPEILFLIQNTNDLCAHEFVLTLSKNFVDNSFNRETSIECQRSLKEWIKIIKITNIQGILPGTGEIGISASDNVRKCTISVALTLLPIIKNSESLLNECLDDVISSVMKSLMIPSRMLRSECFRLLAKIIEIFMFMKSDQKVVSSLSSSKLQTAQTSKTPVLNTSSSFSSSTPLHVEPNLTSSPLLSENSSNLEANENNYKNLINNNISAYEKCILEIYESQFQTAVKIAFSDVSFGGIFLLNYFDYQYSINNSNFKECLNLFTDGMNDYLFYQNIYHTNITDNGELCMDNMKNNFFIAIAAKLTTIAEKDSFVFLNIQEYFPVFLSTFSEVILLARKLWYSQDEKIKNWQEISSFRIKFEGIFETIISSFIFLHSKLKSTNININCDDEEVNFDKEFMLLIDELQRSSELWRISSAFSGILSLFKFNIISVDKMKNCLNLIHEMKKNNVKSSKYYSYFVRLCAEKLTSFDDCWEKVYEMLEFSFPEIGNYVNNQKQIKENIYIYENNNSNNNLNNYLNNNENNAEINKYIENLISTLCYLIKNCNKMLLNMYSKGLFSLILRLPQIAENNNEKCLLLISILFDKVQENCDELFFECFDTKLFKVDFVNSVIFRVLHRCSAHKSKQIIVDYILNNFRNGGIDVVGYVIQQQRRTVSSLFTLKEGKLDKILNDFDFHSVKNDEFHSFCLKMVQLSIIIVNFCKDEDFLIATVLHFSFGLLLSMKDNLQNNDKLVSLCVQIWRIVEKIDKMMFRIAFKQLIASEKEEIYAIVEKATMGTLVKRSSSIKLKKFSPRRTMRKTQSCNEWQNLEA